MRITDAQIHLWQNGKAPPHHRAAPFGIDEALRDMDAAGVSGAINCPPYWDPDANAYAAAAASAHPDRFRTMGSPLTEDRDLVGRALNDAGVVGLRFIWIAPAQVAAFAGGAFDWILEAAAARDAVVTLFLPAESLGHLAAAAARWPRVRFLLDHLGVGPFSKLPDAMAHREALVALAALPNIAVKATATPSMATDDFPYPSVEPTLRALFLAYGSDRFFWGTDITRMPIPWRQCIAMFAEHLPWLSGADLSKVMGEGLRAWVRWP